MTRNEAIKCLDLEDGFTSEDVKHSYARLTKTVRPEEKPEEFSKLNEAYRLLSAELRRRGRNANVSDIRAKNETNKSVEENPASNTTETVKSKEVVSKSDGSLSPEVISKVAADGISEISKTIDDIEDASSKDITNIKANPEWEKQFVNMFAKEDIDRKRLAAIEEELVNVLRLQLLERKNGLKQFFGYGNSSVLKSPEFKAFFAERLINIWLDPEETNLIINYYRLKKSSNSTEDILLLARLNKNKKKLTLTKIAEMFVISFIIAASATMIIHGGLPKDLSAYVIGVITMLIIFFMLLKTRFPI